MRFAFAAFVVAINLVCPRAQAAPLTLAQAVEVALDRSPVMDSARRSLVISELQGANGLGRFFPSVDLGTTQGFAGTSPTLGQGASSRQLNLSLTENLYDNGQSLTQYKVGGLNQQIDPDADMEKTSKSIKALFEQKYGKSGRFSADSDAILIAQMKKFLNLFSILLGAIAIISLIVGGIGITNMMLVSVNERFKEIGIRKAVGATDLSIRFQFLLEAMILCTVAGVVGLVMGFSVYELLIYGASKFVTKLQFEWVLDSGALIISVVSTFLVGLASGLMPALKAEKLQVIEALRTE